jgi:hypothetical protein
MRDRKLSNPDWLKKRNGDGDSVNAIPLLDESLAISSEFSMKPLMEQVLAGGRYWGRE